MPEPFSGTPSNILLIRPSALGDVCRTVPVVASLKGAYPESRIDWVVQDSFVDAVRAHPGVDNVVAFPRRAVAISKWHTSSARRRLREFLGTLRGGGYDLVIDCQGLGRSGFFAWWTSAPERVGYRDAGEFAWLGVNRRVEASGAMHTVDRMLALVEGIGVEVVPDMRLFTPGGTPRAFPGFDESPYIAVAPTSRWPGKRWADDRFMRLVERLCEAYPGHRVVIVGGGNEHAQCPALIRRCAADDRVIDLVGKTSIAQLMHTIEHSAMLIANDSAALHMAVGFDRPVVALFGPTRTELVGPYRRETDVIQHAPGSAQNQHKDEAIGRELMDRITVDEVFEACCERLGS